jgi:hypothetical protein
MPVRRFLLAVTILVSACSSPAPSLPQSQAGLEDVALACWSVEVGACEGALTRAAELLSADHPPIVAASVVAFGCDMEPCAVGLHRGGSASIEFANGGGLLGWSVAVAPDGSLLFGDHTSGLPEPFLPVSARLATPAIDVSLGHCGLGSPIDVDGSFWDPVGAVDSNAAEAINSSEGTFSLVGPNEAQYRSHSGFTVSLRRHEGAKNLFGCD